MVDQADQIVFLSLQIFQIACVHEIVVLVDDPPGGIRDDAVHVVRQRRVVAEEVQAFRNQARVGEGGENDADFRIQVAEPHETVALDAVVDVVLHVHLDGVDAGLPDLVEQRVAAFEGAAAFQIAVEGDGDDVDQIQLVRQNVDPHETEACAAVFHHAHHRELQLRVMDRMVLIRRLHRLADRFAETDAHFAAAASACDDTDAAMQFHAEVQKDIGSFLHVDLVRVRQRVEALDGVASDEEVRLGEAFAHHGAHGRQIFTYTIVPNCLFVQRHRLSFGSTCYLFLFSSLDHNDTS